MRVSCPKRFSTPEICQLISSTMFTFANSGDVRHWTDEVEDKLNLEPTKQPASYVTDNNSACRARRAAPVTSSDMEGSKEGKNIWTSGIEPIKYKFKYQTLIKPIEDKVKMIFFLNNYDLNYWQHENHMCSQNGDIDELTLLMNF